MNGKVVHTRAGASGRIAALQASLFVKKSYVCGGHGARRPKHGTFTVPHGITIFFYVADTESLPNDIGQKVDRILSGRPAPRETEKFTAGQVCNNYHLYSPRNGGYLALGNSSLASDQYITTTDSREGIALKDIVQRIIGVCPVADIHWSACRSVEGDNDSFPDTTSPRFTGKLAVLAGKK